MAEIGGELFQTIFQGDSGDARDLWATLRPQPQETRVEVVTGRPIQPVERAIKVPGILAA